MKKILLLFALFALVKANLNAQYPELPGGGGAYNVQTLPTGSYVIAMDNKNQGDGTSTFNEVISNRACVVTLGNPVLGCSNTSGILVGMEVTGHASIPAGAVVTAVVLNTSVTISLNPTASGNRNLDFGYTVFPATGFNIKAYGLLVTLLNNNVRLKWVIKPGKAKDAADFSVNATRIRPSITAAASYNFAGGPFVVFQQDTAGVSALVQAFNGAASSDDIKLYKTNADVDVDVRYDYLINGVIWKPKVAILDDGGNATIHSTYMTTAAIPAGNYAVETTPAFVTKCYTMATEPHNDNTDTTVSTLGTAAVIKSIKQFVQDGGNFLAQCHAIWTYENYSGGRFMTRHGIWRGTSANSNATITNEQYLNNDLSYGQYEGPYSGDAGGSVTNWKLNPVAGNAWMNNEHAFVTGALADGQDQIRGASAAKLTAANLLGGRVFYVGNHKFDLGSSEDVNGMRFYFNAVLTPTNPQGSLQSSAVVVCTSNLIPTVVNCASTTGPSAAYPLTFQLFKDELPVGAGGADVQEGNTVTFTGPNTASGGISQITAPFDRNPKNYYVKITPAGGCLQPIYLFSACAGTLPVSLKSFTAARSQSNPENVTLKWATATEQNNSGFEVEVNTDGSNWRSVGFVPSQALDGNSDRELSYSFSDNNRSRSMSQYRLRQIDRNAVYKYSEIRSVKGLDQKNGMILFPNPSGDGKFNVVFDESNIIRDISVQDMSGRIVRQMNGVSLNSIQIENLTPGMYTVRVIIRSTGEQVVQKVVINKR